MARIVEAVQHPNADRLRVCQVETIDGRKEIVCGAPNARAGLITIYAPIGTYIPGTGITLEPRPVRGVVSNGMLCSAAELETAEESDGILELAEAARRFAGRRGPRPGGGDRLRGDAQPARLAGRRRHRPRPGGGRPRQAEGPRPSRPTPGAFPCPIEIRLTAPDACPAFAGRLIRGVKNGPSPAWLQARLRAIGLRPISALVDVTNSDLLRPRPAAARL